MINVFVNLNVFRENEHFKFDLLRTAWILSSYWLNWITYNHHHHQPINVPTKNTGLPYGLYIWRTGHKPPSEPSANWWVLTTANAAGTNR
jgi:hypothetical protein